MCFLEVYRKFFEELESICEIDAQLIYRKVNVWEYYLIIHKLYNENGIDYCQEVGEIELVFKHYKDNMYEVDYYALERGELGILVNKLKTKVVDIEGYFDNLRDEIENYFDEKYEEQERADIEWQIEMNAENHAYMNSVLN